MNNLKKLKVKLNFSLLATIIIILIIGTYHIRLHSVEKATNQAKNMAQQLIITRSYLAKVSPFVKVDENKSHFSLSPIYVSEIISEELSKKNVYLKQISLNGKNETSNADNYEKQILSKYNSKTIQNEFWEVTQKNDQKVVRYTKPLYVEKKCLSCHGKPFEDVSKKTYNSIASKYSNNLFNFKEGDIRGMISVAVPLNSDYHDIYIYLAIILTIVIFIYLERKYIFETQINTISKKEEYEQTVIESSNNAIIVIDFTGKITTYNEKAQDMFGWTKDEMLGKRNLSSIIPKNKHEKYKSSLKNYLKMGISSTSKNKVHELEAIKKDGTKFPIHLSIGSKFNLNGAVIVANITDVSKEKEREKELLTQTKIALESNKSKSEFLANMSHEIRTPLNAIMGFIDILKEKETDNDKLKYLNIINSSSKNLLEIINDILDFSKIESGKLKIDYSDFNPYSEFKTSKRLFKAKAQEKGVQLFVSYNRFPKSLNGDILRIKQVINNLLSNAIKFTSKEKSVYIDIFYKDESLSIHVKDEGIGISKEYQKNIFNPFTQEDSSTTRKFGGTGLGLSISYKLVEAMGGELKVKSELNKGSEFYFSIPLKEGRKIEKKKTVKLQKKFDADVLLVEDNKANQVFMKVILKKLGLRFELANDGVEALEIFKNKKFDIVLMDENMPNMNGIETTKHLLDIEKNNNLPHTPIIALTANALKGDRERFLEAGMDEYLTKPIDQDKLKETLSKFLS